MDFFKVIASLEQFLYEAMTWIIFYPRTLWLALSQPIALMDYSDRQQSEPPERQYLDSMSPPLFLMFSILIAHGLEIAFHARTEINGIDKQFFQSHESVLVMRSLLFSLFALVFATTLLRRQGQPLNRDTLRPPFYSQCYSAGAFAVLVSSASAAIRTQFHWLHVAAVAVIFAALAWYLSVQTSYLSERLSLSRPRSLGLAVWIFVKVSLIGLLAGIAILKAQS